MLDVVLAVDGVTDAVKLLEIDQPLQSIPFGESVDEAGPMFEYPTDKIACHADVQNAVRTIGRNINVSTCHAEILKDVDGRAQASGSDAVLRTAMPGHDEFRELA
jgi:hypothetical protein